ncbi:MAG: hypothetical protein KBG48_26120 [Kofleriaceae bacterium]|nr:hypothetical protein [Kofleriaceae bacterium]MBP9170900.1 hypothetical protein [Kofleriaceae bacterium]MBP9861299.1 hypothetical protein [Kofleriaceae bacterium]
MRALLFTMGLWSIACDGRGDEAPTTSGAARPAETPAATPRSPAAAPGPLGSPEDNAIARRRCELQGQRLLRTALGLATRRYLLDHPATRAPAGWDDTLATAPLDRAALVARATEVQREASAALETTTGDCHEALRLDAVHARLAAGSAATGSFAAAAGCLVDFLRAVGESPSVLDIH